MDANAARPEVSDHANVNPAFVFALCGTALVEAWALRFSNVLSLHAVIAAITLAFATVAHLRKRRTHANPTVPFAAFRNGSTGTFSLGNVAWFSLMLAVGFVLGRLVLSGLAIPTVILIIALDFLPWRRACVSGRDLHVSAILLAAGAALALLAGDAAEHPFGILWAGWALWMTALIGFLRRP